MKNYLNEIKKDLLFKRLGGVIAKFQNPAMPIYNSSEVLISNPEVLKQETVREYLNELEPKISALSLAATSAALTPAAPVAVHVAIASNLAGAGIDAYQAYDDFQNKNYAGVTQNTLSAFLSLAGAKTGSKFLQNAAGKKIMLSKETMDKLIHNALKKYNKIIGSEFFLPVFPDINDLFLYYKDKKEKEHVDQ